MTWNEPFRAALAGLFVLVVLGTVWELASAARRKRPPLWAVVSLVALTGVAAALHVLLSPWTHLHEYYHVAENIESSLRGLRFELQGETGPALYRLANELFGGDELAILGTNAVLSTLLVPALVLLDLRLFGRWPRALFAGLLICLLPLHVKFAASESTFIPAMTLSVWALALCAQYVVERRTLALFTGVVALALAAQARPEAIVIVAMTPLLPLCMKPLREVRSLLLSWPTVFAALLFVLLLAPRVATFLEKESLGGHVPEGLRWELIEHQILWDPLRTPESLWLLLLGGVVWALWRRQRPVFWAVLTGEACLLFSLWFFDTPVSSSRTHLQGMPYFCIVAAGSYALVEELLGRWRSAHVAAALVLVALPVHGLWQRYDYVTEELDQQEEWRFLVESIPKLPQGADLAIITVSHHVGKRYLGAFPAFLLKRAGKRASLVDLHHVNEKQAFPAPRKGLLFYQGMYCFFGYPDEPKPAPFSERCQAVRDRYELRPLLVRTLHTRGYSPAVYADGPYEIGFFEVVGVRASE